MPVGNLEDYKEILTEHMSFIESTRTYRGGMSYNIYGIMSGLQCAITCTVENPDPLNKAFDEEYMNQLQATGFKHVINTGRDSNGCSGPDTYTEEQVNAFAEALYKTDSKFNGVLIDALEAIKKYKRKQDGGKKAGLLA